MESTARKRAIVVIGLPGKGKSSILNTLISGNPHGDDFKTGDSYDPVTLKVSHKAAKLHGTQLSA
jgi:hypothetical protein